MYLQIPTNWGRDKLSRVKSSLKILQTLMTSSVEGDSPVLLIFLKNSPNSSFRTVAAVTGRPVSFSVFFRKLETSFRVELRLSALFSRTFGPS